MLSVTEYSTLNLPKVASPASTPTNAPLDSAFAKLAKPISSGVPKASRFTPLTRERERVAQR